MKNILVVYEKGTKVLANAVASKLGTQNLIEMASLMKDKQLPDSSVIGIFTKQSGKGVSSDTVDFVKNILPNCNLEKLDYLFSVSMGDVKPFHSLKIIERLCLKNGIAPSFNCFISAKNRANGIREVVKAVQDGDIRLAEGSLGTSLYMKLKGLK